MADEEDHGNLFKDQSPSTTWSVAQSPHIYPHSHHGTPAQEYSGFVFSSPPLPIESNGSTFAPTNHQRPYHQLQLVMPQWPSMLNGHQSMSQPYHPSFSHVVQPMQPIMGGLPTPVSATSLRSASTPRRTLTDTDRKEMCRYAEKNPDKKQTEIGAMFGVERSTVSKVLRQREKYLFQDEGGRSPVKRLKGRSPDIERALAVWAKNQEKKGLTLDNDMIRDKARAFLATTASPDSHPALSNNWIEKFKMKNSLAGAKLRKNSLSPEDAETGTPLRGGPSPHSPSEELSPPGLHASNSLESLTDDSGEDNYVDAERAPSHSQSMTSINSVFQDSAPGSFSPLSPTSSFFTPDSGTAPGPFLAHHLHASVLSPDMNEDYSQRPRRQTFPQIEQYSGPVDTTISKYPTHSLNSPQVSDLMHSSAQIPHSLQSHHHSDEQGHDRPRSITPTNAMAPPPLPPQYASQPTSLVANLKRSHDLQQPPTQSLITTEDARRAMDTLYEYIQQQGAGFLDFEEGIYLSRLMEKVKHLSFADLHSRVV